MVVDGSDTSTPSAFHQELRSERGIRSPVQPLRTTNTSRSILVATLSSHSPFTKLAATYFSTSQGQPLMVTQMKQFEPISLRNLNQTTMTINDDRRLRRLSR
ncbi:hypothetical protein LXL04_037198 [Taraxacum kok-saghyz]